MSAESRPEGGRVSSERQPISQWPSTDDVVAVLRGAVRDIGRDYFEENPGAVVDLIADNFTTLDLSACRLLAVSACRKLALPEPREPRA